MVQVTAEIRWWTYEVPHCNLHYYQWSTVSCLP